MSKMSSYFAHIIFSCIKTNIIDGVVWLKKKKFCVNKEPHSCVYEKGMNERDEFFFPSVH